MGMKNLVVLSTGLLDGLSHIASLSESLNFCHIQLKEHVCQWKHHPKFCLGLQDLAFMKSLDRNFSFYFVCVVSLVYPGKHSIALVD